jgi:hypothetical protein
MNIVERINEMGRKHKIFQPTEEGQHKNSRRRVPGVVRNIVSKVWPGKSRTRSGRVTK